ncbi:MAG TPA: hypothetical protein VKY70_11655 [Pseudomonas sp.]|nr:hypothetical protein [Pseudomonas sp.]
MARPDRSREIDAALLRAVAEHPHDAAPEVQQMIRRAEVLRDEQGSQLPLLK